MIRTSTVQLTTISAVAYRQKLVSGGAGITIWGNNVRQPGLASISKTSGEAIPTANTPFCSFYSLFYLGAVFCPGWGGFPTHVGRFSALYEKETPHCSSRNSAGFCFSFGGIPLKWPARIGADRGDSAPDPRVRLPGSRCSSLRPPARARYRPRSPAPLDPAPHRPGCR